MSALPLPLLYGAGVLVALFALLSLPLCFLLGHAVGRRGRGQPRRRRQPLTVALLAKHVERLRESMVAELEEDPQATLEAWELVTDATSEVLVAWTQEPTDAEEQFRRELQVQHLSLVVDNDDDGGPGHAS